LENPSAQMSASSTDCLMTIACSSLDPSQGDFSLTRAKERSSVEVTESWTALHVFTRNAKRPWCAKQDRSGVRAAANLGGISEGGPFSWPSAVQSFIEGTVTKSPSPNNRMVCLYCGLESDEATNHPTMDECIAALQREANRLRECLTSARPGVTAACDSTSDRKNVWTASPRLTLVA
jgi:hypothetical protein